jgi:hypothetical protein
MKAAGRHRWEKLSSEDKSRILSKCAKVLDSYSIPEYDSDKSVAEPDRTWFKFNEVIMRATFPQVTYGIIPREVTVNIWLTENFGIKYIWILKATLWHKATYWGFEKWRSHVYNEYWGKRHEGVFNSDAVIEPWDEQWSDLEKEEEEWHSNFREQKRLFLHFMCLCGYAYREAVYVDKNLWRFMNE